MLKTKFVLLFYFIVTATLAAPLPVQSKKQLKQSLRSYDRQMKKMSKVMGRIEKKLEVVNKKALKLTSQKLELDNEIYSMRANLYEQKGFIKNQMIQTRRSLMRLTLNKMGNHAGSTNIVVEKIFIEKLGKDLKTYTSLQKKIKGKEKVLEVLSVRLRDFVRNQQDLIGLANNLEKNKKNKAKSFVRLRNKRLVADKKYKQLKKRIRAVKTGSRLAKKIGLFTPPIEKKVSLEFKKKGVTFMFRQEQPVLCTRAGKIVYRGSLSTYGNVVMIDHGNDMRSVLLGEFKPKVKKGMSVREGQVLGYAKPLSGREGKVYFEVRSKDKAHETIHLLKESKDKAIANN
jgi:murein DD-endopeptidase MepM/ murein hydrolase activator NlpD